MGVGQGPSREVYIIGQGTGDTPFAYGGILATALYDLIGERKFNLATRLGDVWDRAGEGKVAPFLLRVSSPQSHGFLVPQPWSQYPFIATANCSFVCFHFHFSWYFLTLSALCLFFSLKKENKNTGVNREMGVCGRRRENNQETYRVIFSIKKIIVPGVV